MAEPPRQFLSSSSRSASIRAIPTCTTAISAFGYAYLFLDCHDEAIKWFRKSLAEHPSDTPRNRAIALAAIASAEALAGRIANAQNTAAEALRLWPLLTVRGYYQTDFPMSPINVAQVSRMRDGLRLAGLRDHADGDADQWA